MQPVKVVEVPEEGFLALLGQTITCFCAVYIYTGKLVGVNEDCIKLEAPKIVLGSRSGSRSWSESWSESWSWARSGSGSRSWSGSV